MQQKKIYSQVNMLPEEHLRIFSHDLFFWNHARSVKTNEFILGQKIQLHAYLTNENTIRIKV